MRITSATFLALAAVASADKHLGKPQGEVKAASSLGQRLLSKARKLGSDNYESYMNTMNYYSNVRDQQPNYGSNYNYDQEGAEQNWYGNGDENDNAQQNNNNYNANANYDYDSAASSAYSSTSNSAFDTTWLQDYSLKFDGCATDYDSDSNGQTRMELLAKFKLCPNNSGKRCRHSGKYVVPMSDYVGLFQNAVMSDANCQAQSETCYSQCQSQYRYNNAYDNDADDGGRRRHLQNNYNQWKQQQYNYQYNNGNANGDSQEEEEYQNANTYDGWQEQQEQKYEEYQEQYQNQAKQNYQEYYGTSGDEQDVSAYSYNSYQQQQNQNVDYSAYNGGNYATAYRNGDYDAATAGNAQYNYEDQYQAQQEAYQSYQEQLEEGTEQGNYYNRDESNWRNNDQYYNEGEEGEEANYNGYYDEDYCRFDCMADAGMSYCNENMFMNSGNRGYENNMNVPDLVECHQLEYYSSQTKPLWVGAACKNGGVYLDTFTDSACTVSAPAGAYEEALGYSLPEEDLVSTELLPCSGTTTFVSSNSFENYDEYAEYQEEQYQTAVGFCEALYQDSGKCERHMKISNKNVGGCAYINRMSGGSRWAAWLRYGIGMVLAACFFIAAFIGYSKSRNGEAITVDSVRESAKSMQESVSNSVSDMMRRSSRALKEPLAPMSDDQTVASADSAAYVAAELPAQLPVQEMTTEPMTTEPSSEEPKKEGDV